MLLWFMCDDELPSSWVPMLYCRNRNGNNIYGVSEVRGGIRYTEALMDQQENARG